MIRVDIDKCITEINGSRIDTYAELAMLGEAFKKCGFSEGEVINALKMGFNKDSDRDKYEKLLVDESLKQFAFMGVVNDDTLPS